jgi:nucleotidyltransferase AbiEii toxin of type IV toxin-antitoxin system
MHREALTDAGAKLFPALASFADFYLAGGTALALQIGHRISVDFDLFRENPIDGALLRQVKKTFARETVAPIVNNPDELTVLVGSVKLTLLTYPFRLIEPLVSFDGQRMLSVKEIGATKAYTIGRRGTYKDYVDLYFILAEGHASLEEIVAIAERKFGGDFNSRLFTEQLLFMDDVHDFAIDFLKPPVTPEGVRALLKEKIREFNLA